MSWSHCARDEIADNVECPACGLTKEAWTMTLDATRTFVFNKTRANRDKSAWLELEVVDGAGVTCELELPDGQVVKAKLDGAGLLRQEQLYPGECRVRFTGRAIEPSEGVPEEDGWTPCETGRRHPFRWRADAVKIAAPARTHVQWVNVEPDAKDAALGNLLKITLRGAAGQGVFARLERGAKNSARDYPVTTIVGAADDVLRLTGAGDGAASVLLDVGLAGGDTFTLRAGRTEACGDDFIEVTNWRRITCQLTTRSGRKLPDMSAMVKALRDVFIEFEMGRTVLIEEGDASLPPGSWLDASERSTSPTGRWLIAGVHNRPALQGLYASGESLTAVHLLVVDECFDAVTQELWSSPKVPIEVLLEREIVAHAEQMLSPSEHRVEPPPRANEKAVVIFRKNLLDGTPSFISGTWESKAPAGHPDHGKSGPIVLDDVKKIRFSAVTVELVREELARSGGHPVLVRLRLAAARDGNLGQAEAFHMTVVQSNDDVDPLFWSSTVMHELGHVLGQAGSAAAPGLSARGHDRVYLGRDHVGHHCAFGLTEQQWASGHYERLPGTCLMFGEVPDSPNMQFCEKCRPYILADACQPIVGAGGKPVLPPGGG